MSLGTCGQMYTVLWAERAKIIFVKKCFCLKSRTSLGPPDICKKDIEKNRDSIGSEQKIRESSFSKVNKSGNRDQSGRVAPM